MLTAFLRYVTGVQRNRCTPWCARCVTLHTAMPLLWSSRTRCATVCNGLATWSLFGTRSLLHAPRYTTERSITRAAHAHPHAQVTDVVDDSAARSFVPALGLAWSEMLNVRLLLQRTRLAEDGQVRAWFARS